MLVKRYLWAVLVACILALVIGKLNASDGRDTSTNFVLWYPGICDTLEPYTYWWGFFGCEHRVGLTRRPLVFTGKGN